MSKKRKKRSNIPDPGPFAGLYSRHILGAVVDALELEEGHQLTERTARRFFRNANPNGFSRRQIFLAFGQTLIEMGFVPDLSPHLPLQVPSAQVYADSLEFAASRWDAFMSRIQSKNSWDVGMVTAGRCFIGLAAVDLALRLCALNWIAGFDVRLPQVPLWAEENGIGRILRKHTANAGLNRAQLAARLEVSETTVDNWLDGRHWPDRRYVDSLAREFAGGDPARARPLAEELKRQFALARLYHLLSEVVGRDQVISAMEAVSRFAQDLSELVGPLFVPEKERHAIGIHLLLDGCEAPLATEILLFLAAGYPDGERRDVVLAAAWSWDTAFSLARIGEEGPNSAAAGLAQDYLEVVDGPARADAITVREIITRELSSQVGSLIPKGPLPIPEQHPLAALEDGIAVRRRLAERYPDSPEAHNHLGSFLGMVGKNTRMRRFVDEGLLECRIASGLCPAWDTPAVERGIMLTNIGAHQEALQELEQVVQELPEPTPHWHLVIGYVLTELERFSNGLEHLEEVITIRPDYALAYRYAAHCAFRVGDSRKGAEYAKTARRLGDDTEFAAWQRGAYRTRR